LVAARGFGEDMERRRRERGANGQIYRKEREFP
jgi:hypothetical protein